MKATLILINEHKAIIKKLRELGEILVLPVDKENLEKLETMISFFTDFADTYHHQKEEQIYFKWMQSKDEELIHGPLHCMLEEHDTGRDLIQKAKQNINTYKINGDQKLNEEIVSNLNQFGVLLLHHIEKEDKILYPMAEQLNEIDNDGDTSMLEAFNQADQRNSEIANKYNYQNVVDTMSIT